MIRETDGTLVSMATSAGLLVDGQMSLSPHGLVSVRLAMWFPKQEWDVFREHRDHVLTVILHATNPLPRRPMDLYRYWRAEPTHLRERAEKLFEEGAAAPQTGEPWNTWARVQMTMTLESWAMLQLACEMAETSVERWVLGHLNWAAEDRLRTLAERERALPPDVVEVAGENLAVNLSRKGGAR